MKILLTILLFISFQAHAVSKYYVAASGSDAAAGTIGAPWQTAAKVSAVRASFVPGDSIFFNRGDIFTGQLIINNNGTSGSHIVYTTYGTGAKPIINGLVTLGSWTSVGTNLWESGTAMTNSYLNLLTINGVTQDKGRYPNVTDTLKGYLFFETYAHIGGNGFDTYNGSITDDELPSSPNWTGAEIEIRKQDWILDKATQVTHSGHTLTYWTYEGPQGPANYNYGYFILNDPRTLDQQGEWYYYRTSHVVRLYSTVNPSTLTVKASNIDTLVNFNTSSYIDLDGLAIEGADSIGAALQNSQHIVIKNCAFNWTGRDAITSLGGSYDTITYCSMRNNNNEGIFISPDYSSQYNTITYDTIINSGIWMGLGANNNDESSGMWVNGDHMLIQGNVVRNTGYSGFIYQGAYITVLNNVSDSCSQVKNDGGAFYSYNLTSHHLIVKGNVASNGIGQTAGTTHTVLDGANGIYTDDLSTDAQIDSNTIYNCNGVGIFFHNSDRMRARKNLIYNNKANFQNYGDGNAYLTSPAHLIRNDTITDNYIYSRIPSQYLMFGGTIFSDLDSMGVIDRNHYVCNGCVIGGSGVSLSLKGWQGHGYDKVGTYERYLARPYVISAVGTNITLPATSATFDGSNTYEIMDLGASTLGKTYRIRFRLAAANDSLGANIRVYDWNNYKSMTPDQYFMASTTGIDHEFIFRPDSTESSTVLHLHASELTAPITISNLSKTEVTADLINFTDSVRIEANTLPTRKTVLFPATYTDHQNNKQQNGVFVLPFAGSLLQRTGGPVAPKIVKGSFVRRVDLF